MHNGQDKVLWAFNIFGIIPSVDIEPHLHGPEDAERISEEIKQRCMSKFKELAKQLHPDLNPDNQENCHRKMAELVEARDIMKQFSIQMQSRNPMEEFMRQQQGFMQGGGFSGFGGFGGGVHVTIIRTTSAGFPGSATSTTTTYY